MAVLLFGFGSAVDDVTVAEFVMIVPDAVPVGTVTTNVNVVVAPDANEARLQVTVPDAPTAGCVQVPHEVPVCVNELYVVVPGVASVNTFVDAVAGPLFLTVIVYVMVPVGET